MPKLFLQAIFFVILLILFPFSLARADGCFIPTDYQFGDIYEPSQTALIVYDGGQEDLYLKVNYDGDTNDFVWIVPTPAYPTATEAADDIFIELSALTATSHWAQDSISGEGIKGASPAANVIVHSQEIVGIYEVTVLSATGVDGLFDWLNSHGYKLKEEAKDILDWYVQKEWYFTAMRINPAEPNQGSIYRYSSYIEPIKISFKSNSIVYPLKVSQISTLVPEEPTESSRTNEILLYVMADKEVKAPGFITEYAQAINAAKLNEAEQSLYSEDLDSLKMIVSGNDYFLTKLRRDFAKCEMDEDLYLVYGKNPEIVSELEVDFFHGEGCPHCTKAETFLYQLSYVYPDMKINSYEVYNNTENKSLYQQRVGELGIAGTGVPLVVVGNEYVLGFGDDYTSGSKIRNLVDKNLLKALSLVYSEEQEYAQAKNSVHGSAMADRLKGKIVLKVEDEGQAYYINPVTKYSHYLGRPADAFAVMREQGIGIRNSDLEKIPLGLGALTGQDSDSDGLPDLFEDAIHTDKNNSDSDNDGFNDKAELDDGYMPSGSGKLKIDNNFAQNQSGKIFLQVEQSGEAWYVNPGDNKRYFLGRPADAFAVMRNLGLGISNADFDQL